MKAATASTSVNLPSSVFQSTPPVKAATAAGKLILMHDGISIHAAREGGDAAKAVSAACEKISIHAAREGGDNQVCGVVRRNVYFNPRRP